MPGWTQIVAKYGYDHSILSDYRSVAKQKEEDQLALPLPPAAATLTSAASGSTSTPPVAVTRRRRRRSVTKESQSPAKSPIIQKSFVNAAAVCNDADGEDNADREDSPEHIYHQIGTDEVLRVSKARSSRSPERKAFEPSDRIIITKNSASRMPRFPSKGTIIG